MPFYDELFIVLLYNSTHSAAIYTVRLHCKTPTLMFACHEGRQFVPFYDGVWCNAVGREPTTYRIRRHANNALCNLDRGSSNKNDMLYSIYHVVILTTMILFQPFLLLNTESLIYFPVELWEIDAASRSHVKGSFLGYSSETDPQIYFISDMVVATV